MKIDRLAPALVLALAAVAALPARAGGPPVLLAEVPASPIDEASVGAEVIVRAMQCGQPLTAPVTGTAVGVVNGAKRTIPIHLTPTTHPGTYAVKRQWPEGGQWVLAFTCQSHGTVTTLVEMGSSKTKGKTDAPAATVTMVRRTVPASEIDALLAKHLS